MYSTAYSVANGHRNAARPRYSAPALSSLSAQANEPPRLNSVTASPEGCARLGISISDVTAAAPTATVILTGRFAPLRNTSASAASAGTSAQIINLI